MMLDVMIEGLEELSLVMLAVVLKYSELFLQCINDIGCIDGGVVGVAECC